MIQNTLKLISIQHELGMAIGLDLHLKAMLKQFIQVALKRLALSGVDFYLASSTLSHNSEDLSANGQLSHILSVPMQNKPFDAYTLADLQVIFLSLQQHNIWHEEYNDVNHSYTYYFSLPSIGLICLHRKANPLEKSYLTLLFPIFKRLAISCQASLEHEQLLHAIEARKEAESTITYKLLHDELTQLPNRRMLMSVLTQDIERAKEKYKLGALLFIDLDRFKAINDTLGHDVGDQLLQAVARILLNAVRENDLVARLSGDEFVLLIKNIQISEQSSRYVVDKVLRNIYDAFIQPIKAGEHVLHISPSIGIDYYPWGNVNADKVLRNADTAMYIAKAQGQYCAVYYEEYMSTELERRLDIEKKFQIAVKTCEQFVLEYQPQYNGKGECIGAEALTRWKLPSGTIVPPELFVAVAEETGLILDLGKWVIQTACKDIQMLEQTHLPHSFKKISVNVSALQFNHEQFVPFLFEQIETAQIQAEHLCIELTESALIKNVSNIREKIVLLQERGIDVSVDDFGTGYSSLSYLNRFPITTLKIDQSFVRNMHIDKGNRAIVKTILALAKSLSLIVIAEGVENREELKCLRKLGCEYFQGFYFNHSFSFTDFVQMVNTPSASSVVQNEVSPSLDYK